MSSAARTTRRLGAPLLLAVPGLAAFALAACGGDPESIIYGDTFSVDPSSVTATVGSPVPLTARPGDWPVTDQSVRWFSNDSTIFRLDTLTVAPPHRVTGHGLRVGLTSVTVSTDRGRQTMTIPITVTRLLR